MNMSADAIHCERENNCWPMTLPDKKLLRGIATHWLGSALRRSCVHELESSFELQVQRLLIAGFPRSVITLVAETLLQKLKPSNNPKVSEGDEQDS